MVEDHADNERKPAATTFQLAARDILYLHRQEYIHDLAIPVVEQWLE